MLLFEAHASKLKSDLEKIKHHLAIAAQKVYNNWDQVDGHDEHYGTGGICDDIAEAMCEVVNQKLPQYGCFHLYDEYACHTSIYVYDTTAKLIFNVDISPYNYETGGGYTWKKITGVTFSKDMVTISDYMLDYDQYVDENGDIKEFY